MPPKQLARAGIEANHCARQVRHAVEGSLPVLLHQLQLKLVELLGGCTPVQHLDLLRLCIRRKPPRRQYQRRAVGHHRGEVHAGRLHQGLPELFTIALPVLANDSLPLHAAGVLRAAAGVHVALEVQRRPPVCEGVRAAEAAPQERAVVEAEAVSPTTHVHDHRALCVWKHRVDVPQATRRRKGPELIAGRRVHGHDLPRRLSAITWKSNLTNTSDHNTSVSLNHVAVGPSCLGYRLCPQLLASLEIQCKHQPRPLMHSVECRSVKHTVLSPMPGSPQLLAIRAQLDGATVSSSTYVEVFLIVYERSPNDGTDTIWMSPAPCQCSRQVQVSRHVVRLCILANSTPRMRPEMRWWCLRGLQR
mmetsp:Transcript_111093/g.269969  ORF Transcript_111093/g.269969 Transcript_111093/m.269969 type:complete len:361 (+) Transcript_111093:352-1434(+)